MDRGSSYLLSNIIFLNKVTGYFVIQENSERKKREKILGASGEIAKKKGILKEYWGQMKRRVEYIPEFIHIQNAMNFVSGIYMSLLAFTLDNSGYFYSCFY